MKQLTLIRGLPGSGKSTLAKKLQGLHLEADMYFIGPDGKYEYDGTKIQFAHQWCLATTKRALHNFPDAQVIVSNTFTTRAEMQPYLDLGVPTSIILLQNDFGNIHNVPKEAIDRMRARFEYEI